MKYTALLLFYLCSLFCVSQELPPIIKYGADTYLAGNQNWMISQDSEKYVYFANNYGLLQYNGANWSLYPAVNETIIRSVKVIHDKIYTGCYMEFGFWQKNSKGILEYTSLSAKIKDKIIDDEQFWTIIDYDQWVVFQSLNQIYIYDSVRGTFKVIHPNTGIIKAYKTKNAIYYQLVDGNFYEIENGNSRLVISGQVLQSKRIVSVFQDNEGLLFQTQHDGFYRYHNNQLSRWVTEADAEIMRNTVYSAIALSDNSYAIGTVSNGVYNIDAHGKLVFHLTQNKGLSNNTALSLFEDKDKNLWIGLDNGINCINIASPIKTYLDNTGILGTVYTALHFKDYLYVGTNQGLFYKKDNTNNDFTFISGTKGQVWSLFSYDNTLFCGQDSGTAIIDKGSAQQIYYFSGTWKFERCPNNPNLLLQGNYSGLSVLEKKDGRWTYRNKITGFDYSSKYFELDDPGEIYVSHEYKGIFRLSVTPDLRSVSRVTAYTFPAKSKNASLVKYNSMILYASREGVFKLNPATKQFSKEKNLSKAIEQDSYTSGKMIADDSGKLWLFTKNAINYFTVGKLNHDFRLNTIPIPSSVTNSMLGYENITRVDNSNYLIGTTDGYYAIRIDDLNFTDYAVGITAVTQSKFTDPVNIAINQEEHVPYSFNNLTFSYSVPEYNKYVMAEYQYLLEGFYEEWSEWSPKTTANFKKLPYGEYTFKVRARIGNEITKNIASYHFTVLRPWYATTIAIIIYVLLFSILLYFVNRAYKSYYQKQNEKLISENKRQLEMKELENEQQIMKVKNDQLIQDVDSKNRELAISTMSLIKKNEFLTMIKDDLKKSADDGKNIKSVITTINKNISEEDTWDLFKEAFNNADKDFLKKVKSAHPSLTPNDLRLCAYLRLNLSSKEIAPLLNISVRSVEIKRYRLRKKMDLPHEKGLVEYILSL